LEKAESAAILAAMPAPKNERDAWERELREELPVQLASYQQELAAGPATKTRHEWLVWQIRRVRRRAAQFETWLAKISTES
jgi:hypothetical protein